MADTKHENYSAPADAQVKTEATKDPDTLPNYTPTRDTQGIEQIKEPSGPFSWPCHAAQRRRAPA